MPTATSRDLRHRRQLVPAERRWKIEWQRDFFDFGHVQKLYMKLMKEGKLSKGMSERIERSLAGEKLPGYYPLGEAPVPIW
jgi:hypothetical protein